jgi:hypothetical protein
MTDNERQAALRKALEKGWLITEYEARWLGLIFEAPGATILEDQKLLRPTLQGSFWGRNI